MDLLREHGVDRGEVLTYTRLSGFTTWSSLQARRKKSVHESKGEAVTDEI
jgi:hypothetical protein